MDPNLKLSDLTSEQQAEIKKIGKKFLKKAFITGISGFITLFLLNVVTVFANVIFFQSSPLQLVVMVGSTIAIVLNMSKKNTEDARQMRAEMIEVIERRDV